jgi:hypothetical protein
LSYSPSDTFSVPSSESPTSTCASLAVPAEMFTVSIPAVAPAGLESVTVLALPLAMASVSKRLRPP